MDFKRKIEISKSSITSISRADDKDSVVRKAALDRLGAFIEQEKSAIDERLVKHVEGFGEEEQQPAG